jgi:eight-cysteine-cluster-containing protein
MRTSHFSNSAFRLMFLAGLLSLFWIPSGTVISTPKPPSPPAAEEPPTVLTATAPDSLSSTSTYYVVRRDLRRCAAPMCGGYYLKRVNHAVTRCANGQNLPECYVADIDWNGHAEPAPGKELLRGTVLPKRFRGRMWGTFRVSEAWERAGTARQVHDTFLRVRDRGLRCITHPCATHHAAKLNSTSARDVAGVDLNGCGASDESISAATAAMTGAEGILVAGRAEPVSGPGGRSVTVKASQLYLRAGASGGSASNGSEPPSDKACMKTGCSGQVCADEEVVTTCEYRPEYDCYKRAACARQRNGKCGFTPTPELTACLARARRQQ